MSCENGGYDGNGMGHQPQTGYTIEELQDIVQQELSVGCLLPKQLPLTEIRRIVETRAMPYFYRKYQFAVQKIYYLIAYEAFCTQEFTKYKAINLPCEIQSVTYLYPVRRASLYQLGINTPNLSVNLGVTNQPFLSSYVTTIGELGVYKTILDQMSDMMDQLNKYTLKHHFNQLQHRLHILTKVESDVIVEAYANIKPEFLFQDDLFIKYVSGMAKIQLGNLNGRYNLQLPGGVTVNSQDLVAQGKDDVREVEEEIKSQTTSSFFMMIKK
jgi:hypothetical protein